MSKQTIREKLRMDRWKKEDYIVLALVGVLLLIIAMPVERTSEKNAPAAGEESQGADREFSAETDSMADSYGEYWEKRLETALSQMEGVGKAKVMITLEDSGETIVEMCRYRPVPQKSRTVGAAPGRYRTIPARNPRCFTPMQREGRYPMWYGSRRRK